MILNSILPEYGSREDLENLIKEAHARDIKVVMDLILNHSGSDHPWFQEALQGSVKDERDSELAYSLVKAYKMFKVS